MFTERRSTEPTDDATTASSGLAKKCNSSLVGDSSTRIFDLPQDIFHKLFNEYLSMRELLAFDSSVCNHADRSKYLALLATVTIKSYCLISSKLQLRWIHRRQVRLEVVEIGPAIDKNKLLRVRPLHWSSIKEWHFIDGPEVDADLVVNCLLKCSSLETLTLGQRDFAECSGSSFSKEYAYEVLKVFDDAAFCDHIRCVKFVPSGIMRGRLTSYCTPKAVMALTKHCRKLTHIDFGIVIASHALMMQFFEVCGPTLQSFVVNIDAFYTARYQDSFTKDHLPRVFQYCPRLQSVSLDKDSYTIDALVEIGRHCPDLLKLDVLCHNFSLTDDALIALFENCRKLKKLHLVIRSGDEAEDENENENRVCMVTDRAIIKASECCQDLRKVHLVCIPNLTVKSLKSLARHCPLMEELFLTDLISSTSEMISFSIEHSFPDLRELTLCNCQLSDRFLLELSRKSPLLKRLCLHQTTIYHSKVTNKGMQHIAAHCSNLTRFELSGLLGVTEPEPLIDIVRNNAGLNKSNFKVTPALDFPVVNRNHLLSRIITVVVDGQSLKISYTKQLDTLLQSRE